MSMRKCLFQPRIKKKDGNRKTQEKKQLPNRSRNTTHQDTEKDSDAHGMEFRIHRRFVIRTSSHHGRQDCECQWSRQLCQGMTPTHTSYIAACGKQTRKDQKFRMLISRNELRK